MAVLAIMAAHNKDVRDEVFAPWSKPAAETESGCWLERDPRSWRNPKLLLNRELRSHQVCKDLVVELFGAQLR